VQPKLYKVSSSPYIGISPSRRIIPARPSQIIGTQQYQPGPNVYFREGIVGEQTLYLPEYRITGEMGQRPQVMTLGKKGSIWTPETKLTEAELKYEAESPNLKGGVFVEPKSNATPFKVEKAEKDAPIFYREKWVDPNAARASFNYDTRPPINVKPVETTRTGGGVRITRQPEGQILGEQTYQMKRSPKGFYYPDFGSSPMVEDETDALTKPQTEIIPITETECETVKKVEVETKPNIQKIIGPSDFPVQKPGTEVTTRPDIDIQPEIKTFPAVFSKPMTTTLPITSPATQTQPAIKTITETETTTREDITNVPDYPIYPDLEDEEEEPEKEKKKRKYVEISEVTPLEGFIPGLDIYLPTVTNLPKAKPVGTLTETIAGTKARTKATPKQEAIYGAKRKSKIYSSDGKYLGRTLYARNLGTAI